MAIFDFMKICVFTDVDGVVMLEGKPVSGTKLVRTAKVVFNNDEFKDEAITDSEGRFHFDAIYSRSMNAFLPSEKLVSQQITIHHNNKLFDAWRSVKHNYNYNGELNVFKDISGALDKNLKTDSNGLPVVPFFLSCELTDDSSYARAAGRNNEGNVVVGLCRWPGEIVNN